MLFEQINSITYRVDAPNKRGAGWLMDVAWPGVKQRWIARVGKETTAPLAFDDAKQAATEMLRGAAGDYVVRHPIVHLNGPTAQLLDKENST